MTQTAYFNKALRYSGYGVGDFGMNLFWNSLSLLLIYWYTNVVRIEPATAGLIFFIATVWDAVTDPVMAVMAERTNTRWGSYRPYLVFGGVALGLSFMLLFWAPPFTGVVLFIALLGSHLLFRTMYTLVSIPYSALTSRITSDSRDRTLLSCLRMLFAFLGLLTVSAFAFPIIRFWGDGEDTSKSGFVVFAGLCGVVAAICYFVTFLSTREEPVTAQPVQKDLRSFFAEMRVFALQNHAMHTMLIMIFAHSSAYLIFASTITFFIESNESVRLSKEQILAANGLTTMLSVPIWTVIAHQIGKRKTWAIAGVIASSAGFHLAIFGPVFAYGYVVHFIFISAATGGFALLVWSMIPDIIEYGEWKIGIRSESAVYGIGLFVQKLAIGVAGLLVGVILQLIGYAPQLSIGADAGIGRDVQIVTGLVPAILWALSIFTVSRHPISKANHETAILTIKSTQDSGAQ